MYSPAPSGSTVMATYAGELPGKDLEKNRRGSAAAKAQDRAATVRKRALMTQPWRA